jgi:glutathione S-transferase
VLGRIEGDLKMMELYHFGMSTCSQKVRLVFAEKELEFVSHAVNLAAGEQHNPEYVKLNPMHVVPTLVHDGAVFVESSLIIRYLDDLPNTRPMQPADAAGRYRVSWWLNYIDKKVHPQAPNLTFAIGPRDAILRQPKEAVAASIAAIPDPVEREARRSVIEHGIEAPEFGAAAKEFLTMTDLMEAQLARTPWLSGDRFGLADATVAPYVLRLDQMGMTPVISEVAKPRLSDWFARVRARQSYKTAVEDWMIPALAEMFREKGQALWPDIERIIQAI